MIKELNSGLGQDRPGLVEDGGRVLAFLLVERALVRDPGAAGIAQPKFLGVARNALRVIPEPFERKMAANRFELVLLEHLAEFRRTHIVGARQFHVFDAQSVHLFQRGRNVAREFRA